ncbi:MAG: flavin monoamine oxidase family protein [Myxococcota bacterium]
MSLGGYAHRQRLSTDQALASAAAARSRRDFLAATGKLAAAASLGVAARPVWAAPRSSDLDVAIVGAGLAGLSCAITLQRAGIYATVYEASPRVGGRCYSLRGVFPGQVAERGGELIDNLHKTMLGYASALGLTLEDMGKQPGDVAYYVGGRHYAESVIVDEYRAFVTAMRDDLRTLSSEPSAAVNTAADVALDRMSLAEYLATRRASPVLRAVIEEAYEAEYGLAAAEQSALNFLLFIHADRRSKFTPFGVFSDERYHVVEGNDAIASGLAEQLRGQVHTGMQLVAARKTSGNRVELALREGSRTHVARHDAVVLTLPFTALRDVSLDASLALPPAKRRAIAELGYGMNAKTLVGFSGRPWSASGGNGAAYADLANVQTTWETNPSLATPTRAVITDYASASRGAALDPARLQRQVGDFLRDFELVFPGAAAAASRDERGNYRAHLEAWPKNPLTKGSYTCYLPGQFTSIAGLEGTAVDNLFFAGEHTDSFYSWQGFMEGACLSGIRAAGEVLARK